MDTLMNVNDDFIFPPLTFEALIVRKGFHPVLTRDAYSHDTIERIIGGPYKIVRPFSKALYPALCKCVVYCSVDCPDTVSKVSRDIFNDRFIVIGFEDDTAFGPQQRSLTEREAMEASKLFFNFAPLYTETTSTYLDF